MIRRVCFENGYQYIEDVHQNGLFKNDLHLQNSGKITLPHNSIVNFQTFGTFLENEHGPLYIGQPENLV